MNLPSNDNSDNDAIQNHKRESLLKKVLEHSDDILDGVSTNKKLEKGEVTEDEAREIERRRTICKDCPFSSDNGKAAGWYSSLRPDNHCTICGCVIKFKTACLDCNCGIEDFNKVNPDNPAVLKWVAYHQPETNE